MIPLALLKDLEQLEETAKVYLYGKTHYLTEPKSFNFSLLKRVQISIEGLPLNQKKIELMERYQKVFTQISSFHPKIIYLSDFNNEINTYKPLYKQLASLEQQAMTFYNSYFNVNKPTFDWDGLCDIRSQISNLKNSSDKIQLMQLFEHGVLTTISQVRPKTYSELTFESELEDSSQVISSDRTKSR
ncbi:hypothetical protein [Fluoribacter gormanii]|uniref:Uncharacterized protein n=1 Tax=Fluoribacter gormanii TaxID=464 RepID=A0A377GLY5_9GAMM|nr:hypothetical protein [Fluoribacter gormanii]KTD01009.1 hypothetical protein Lgor_2494 [Fluoribacter gormanii]SIR78089.1 hypothetical protein SAMN05421777_12432 [Fluoribacter gormanii]STO25505.1 Uncharacterised protein [Fluoribacter gormanii]